MYTLLLALIYLAFISLGLPDSLLGAGWPTMHTAFQVSISSMGIISMIISGSTIVSSLLSDKLTRKLSTQIVTVGSVFLTAVALLGFSFATKFWMLMVFAIPYGLGAGAIDAALNNYVALHYSSKHMSWLHCFWGIGAIISPFIMSYALTTSVWHNGYRIVSMIQFIIGTILLITLPVWKIHSKTSLETAATQKSLRLIDTLRIPSVSYLLCGFFAYCAAEATAMGWASTFLVQVKDVDAKKAAAFASLVFIGITIGRFIGGFLMDKFGDRKMIQLGTCVSLVGVILLVLPLHSDVLIILGFVILGLGYAPVYPCIIHATPSNFGKENSGSIIGVQMASAYIGNTFMPPLYGLLGKYIGFQIMPMYLMIFLVLMIFMLERTFAITSHNKTPR